MGIQQEVFWPCRALAPHDDGCQLFGLTRFTRFRESLNEMLRPDVELEGQYPSSWALGWQIFNNPQRDFIYHGGDNEGFHCGTLASVEKRCGYFVMTNGENGPEVLRKLVTDDLMQQFLAS